MSIRSSIKNCLLSHDRPTILAPYSKKFIEIFDMMFFLVFCYFNLVKNKISFMFPVNRGLGLLYKK